MSDIPATYQGEDTLYIADSCEPLKAAAARGEVALWAWGRSAYPGQRLPPRRLPEVRSVGVWDAVGRQRWGLERHCNEGIELTYVARGRTAFEVDGKHWQLRRGHLTITRPWQWHAVGDPEVDPCRLYWLILDVGVRRPNQPWAWPEWLLFSPTELQALTRLLSHNEHPVWPAGGEVAGGFERLAQLLKEKSPADGETALKLCINEIFIALLEMLQQAEIPLDARLSSSQRAVELFLNTLPDHAGREWDLDSMADQCGLSRSQFASYCKQITNMTPIEYLNHCRVEQATEWLRNRPDRTITDIALACGFSTSQYFATVFRAQRGCTPTQYRRRAMAAAEVQSL